MTKLMSDPGTKCEHQRAAVMDCFGNAQSYRRYGATRTYAPQPYPPQSRGSIPRGVPRTVPFSDPNSPEATGGGNIGYNRGLPDGGY
jgi:hypothetical protein